MTFDVNKMKEKWPSAIVARHQIGLFTGGLISPKTMANLAAAGKGPDYFRTERNSAYDVDVFCEWFQKRLRTDK